MAKPGPKKGSKLNRPPSRQFAIRLELDLLERIEKRAKQEGRTMSGYVRRVLTLATRNETWE